MLRRKKRKYLWGIAIFVLAMLASLKVAPIPIALNTAIAHDWYPYECCSAMDCAVVDKTETVPADKFTSNLLGGSPAFASIPLLVVTTKHGTVVVPANFPRRESK